MTTAKASPPRGPEVIKAHVLTLPRKPGVYRMLDDHGEVLYVGKARDLKSRVSSYTRLSGHTTRLAAMIARTAAMEFVTTANEAQALLLEASLIKRFRPPYNVVLRDDKSFPYILITQDHAAPRLSKHRGARRKKGRYFGPFASASAVNRTLHVLQKSFLLRSCSDGVYANRTRPCLLYQIRRCAGPCTGEISPEAYQALVNDAFAFLSGRSREIERQLGKQMEGCAARLDFERAALYRDRIVALNLVTTHQSIAPQRFSEADVFGLARLAGQFCVQVFFFRAGQNWGTRAYFPRAGGDAAAADVLGAFIAQFYDNKLAPRLILASHALTDGELLARALSTKAGHAVALATPKKGEKRRLCDHAADNAAQALARKLSETRSQAKILEKLRQVFKLKQTPQRIEVYDNSHIQGSLPVGAMIVAGPQGFCKAHYRKFNIDSQTFAAGDDYAMMRQVITRRFTRLLREAGPCQASSPADVPPETGTDALPAWPDLLLIDGGAGHTEAVRETLSDLGLTRLTVVGVAKGVHRNAGREHFHIAGQTPFMLDSHDPVLYYLQRLRDEAHRFAIGAHRTRRKKAVGMGSLDEIQGIGPMRKKALLLKFGSARQVARASVEELQDTTGISQSLAQVIFAYFHDEEKP